MGGSCCGEIMSATFAYFPVMNLPVTKFSLPLFLRERGAKGWDGWWGFGESLGKSRGGRRCGGVRV